MKHLFPVPGILLLASGGHAAAADLTVAVSNAAGKPVAFAVVTYIPAGGAVIPVAEKGKAFIMAQKNIRFTPYVLPVQNAPEHQSAKNITIGKTVAMQAFSIKVRQAAPTAGQY